MIWIEDVNEASDAIPEECTKAMGTCKKKIKPDRTTPFDRTRAVVYATGNKWAIENFEATHN